jgi:hypothetical protein
LIARKIGKYEKERAFRASSKYVFKLAGVPALISVKLLAHFKTNEL